VGDSTSEFAQTQTQTVASLGSSTSSGRASGTGLSSYGFNLANDFGSL
jgi:hypothetical protein